MTVLIIVLATFILPATRRACVDVLGWPLLSVAGALIVLTTLSGFADWSAAIEAVAFAMGIAWLVASLSVVLVPRPLQRVALELVLFALVAVLVLQAALVIALDGYAYRLNSTSARFADPNLCSSLLGMIAVILLSAPRGGANRTTRLVFGYFAVLGAGLLSSNAVLLALALVTLSLLIRALVSERSLVPTALHLIAATLLFAGAPLVAGSVFPYAPSSQATMPILGPDATVGDSQARLDPVRSSASASDQEPTSTPGVSDAVGTHVAMSGESRTELASEAFSQLIRNPFGFGWSNARVGANQSEAHNEYLNVALGLSVPGVILLCSLLIILFNASNGLSSKLVVGMVAVIMLVHQPMSWRHVWVLVAIAIALDGGLNPRHRSLPRMRRRVHKLSNPTAQKVVGEMGVLND